MAIRWPLVTIRWPLARRVRDATRGDLSADTRWVMQSNGKPEPELNDGFAQGGWQLPYFDQDMDRLTADWIAAASAFLLGRQTHELFAEYWSQVTDPGDPPATRLNALPNTSCPPPWTGWNGTTRLCSGATWPGRLPS